ncbi:CwfJ domain protein [Aspergillus arachidicola]|uniref:CwfJ domain protein n=1 Tax=Aspergillus arachidicola TaxID=656916 RepID=A0A2G7FMF6_9EURO|nr:CwfJ domain protein [Aspergillus arachidicola]
MASKIIVIGGVNCQLREVFTKLAKLHVKQSFSFAIVVGDLFGDCSTEQELDEISALFQGSISVPLPTYFTLGSRPLPTRVIERIEANDEVCPNLYYLGKRGTLKTSEGIRLVALGGNLETESQSSDKYHPSYTESDARALYGAHSADILITHQWPKGIRTRSQVPIPDEATKPEEVQCIADLSSTLKPRYHLSSAPEFFYEREPFFHMPPEDNPDAKPLTRFISLASYNNPSKQKWMYAFTLDPKAPHPLTIPTGTTASPLAPVQSKRKPLSSQKESYSRFAVDDEGSNRPRKRARGPPPGPDQCFFCLSNPNIATHLITSIGNEAYLTTAKGPLPTSKTFPTLGFPGHMLIIPSPTPNPIQHPRRAIPRGNGIHTHWQFLPVPGDLVTRGLVTAAFKVEAENLKYPKFESPSSTDPSTEPGDFFRVWIWGPNKNSDSDADASSGETEKMLLLPLGPEFRFDLQFGRRVMAKLMELEGRINWKNDVQSQEEEEADATAFKDAFKEFDFTLEE